MQYAILTTGRLKPEIQTRAKTGAEAFHRIRRMYKMTEGGTQALMAFLSGGGTGQNKAFREIVEILPVAIYATDAEGRLTYFNDAARKLSGRTPELGTDNWRLAWKIFLPDGTLIPHDQCPMALAFKGVSVPNGIECFAERPDGTRFWFTPYTAVLRDDEG